MKRIFATMVIFCLLINITSCSEKSKKNDISKEEKKVDITLGCRPFRSSVAQAYLIKEIIEESGYKAEVKIVTKDELWNELRANIINATDSSWFYDISYGEYKKNEDKVVDLGVNCKNFRKGLLVPKYVQIAEISELNMYKKRFNNKILCYNNIQLLCDLAEKANTEYNLNFDIEKKSEKEIIEELDEAVKNKKWIVVTGYTPNWILKKYDLRFLEDTKLIFGNDQESHTLVNKGLETKNKEIYNILDRFYLYESELNELLLKINENGYDKITETVKEWLKENPQMRKRERGDERCGM